MSDQQLKVIPAEEIAKRFDKIEVKLDKLSDAMIALARNEEKISSLEDQLVNIHNRVNRHSDKIDELTEISNENKRTTQNVNKFVWVVVAAVVGMAIKTMM